MKPSILISAFPDEAPSSWLVRLSNSNYLDVKTFCSVFELTNLLKTDIDINFDLSKSYLQNSRIILPTGLKQKIPDLKWQRRTCDWLIMPNKKGFAHWNTFSQLCPVCLADFEYFRNSWKIKLFNGCIRCERELISSCPNCSKTPSTLKGDYNAYLAKNYNPLFYCWACHYDFRLLKAKPLTSASLIRLQKIERAYSEVPSNMRYLEYLQYGYLSEITSEKSSKSYL